MEGVQRLAATHGFGNVVVGMSDTVRVLVAVGSAGETDRLLHLLNDADFGDFQAVGANSLAEVLAHLRSDSCDVALVSLEQPDSRGYDTFETILAAAPELPLIVMAESEDEALASHVIGAGAQDFLIRPNAVKHVLVRVLRNALERHRLMARIREAQKRELEMKDQFFSQISHELRTPLAAIYQFVTLLLDDCAGPLRPEQRELLDLCLANVERLKAMISDLLDLARTKSGKLRIEPEAVDIEKLAGACVAAMRPLAQRKGIEIRFESTPGLPLAWGDPERSTQVLSNLIDNALKFTDSGGRVSVYLSRAAEPGFLKLCVQDTGCGISPENLTRIFERLYQEKPHSDDARRGLGLGLFISRELAERQGGRLSVESTPGRGSRFCFTLPEFNDRD